MEIKCSECDKKFKLKDSHEIIDYECPGLRNYGNKDGAGWVDCICPNCGITLTVGFDCIPYHVNKSEFQSDLE